VKNAREIVGWAFWLKWMIASALGSAAGVICWLALGATLEAAGLESGSSSIVARTLIPGLVGAAFGTPFGISQWLVLRGRVSRAGRWVLATALGYVVVFLFGATAFLQEAPVKLSAPQEIMLGAFLGAAVALPPSILQWLLVLRRQIFKAGWWVFASAVGWALGFAISFALRLAFGELTFVAGPVIALALIGLAMVRLLRLTGTTEARVQTLD
jgi:hypothetical protein